MSTPDVRCAPDVALREEKLAVIVHPHLFASFETITVDGSNTNLK